ncbi:lysosomal Pro-X carboxypeptidase [Panicum miliaceum]|uniref:Lysosomal Pro-X carboxypeptidase n=1 Tax=Panicum miliaceum TaxID=4540 RepID=A0A3L6S3L5_PANMI|nr:lysosomal Pro-X carboxypeptidase [Panicum miliaceum]
MVAPSLVAFLPPFLLILVAAISPEPTVAADSKPKPFPPPTPLRMRALLRHERGSSSRGGNLVVTAAADGASNGTAANPFTAHHFPQELDHFTFWRRPSGGKGATAAAGPMFVYTGNVGDIELDGHIRVAINDNWHRFYGNDSEYSTKTLGYLTSTKALADYVILITSLKRNLSAEDTPVVVFGGSYGGMLASWFRLKYLHIAIGALASSAPILQFDYITPWSSFYDAVSQDYKSESLNCFAVIKATWDVLDERGSSDKGLLELSKLFRACKTVKYADSIGGWLETAFTYTAMVDYPAPANFTENLPAYPVKEACTEMIMPMSTSNESMFPPSTFSYDDMSDACFQLNGVRPRPHWITTEYGGYRIDKVLKRFGSNIVFSNGMRDPWSRGGVLKNISSSIVALVTEKGAHHLDLRSATKNDPDWLVEQRRQEVEIIQGWIDQYHQDMA